LFQENRELRSEIDELKQEMAVYKELLGHPAIQASGQGDKAVKAQAPTGLFLFTHQQALINGAMQFACYLHSVTQLPPYAMTAVTQIVQQQLDASDASTKIQQILDRWRWKPITVTTSFNHQCVAYATATDPTTQKPLLCTFEATGDNQGRMLSLNYTDNAPEARGTTLLTCRDDKSIPDTLHWQCDPLVGSLAEHVVDEAAIVNTGSPVFITAIQGAPTENLDTTICDGDPTGEAAQKLSIKYKARRCIIESTYNHAAANATPCAYVLYQRVPTPPTTPIT
jgi:hypothetical protein